MSGVRVEAVNAATGPQAVVRMVTDPAETEEAIEARAGTVPVAAVPSKWRPRSNSRS